MADGTKIEWTDATVNAVNGCSVVSPGCKHCFAMKQAHRFDARRGLTQHTAGGMVWTGEVRLNEKALIQPLGWKRARRIFWNAHGDLFHESVPAEWIDKVFAVCALTPQHQHQILTKRPARMRQYFADPETPSRIIDHALRLLELPHHWQWPLPNVWLGTSVDDQKRADERIPDLLATPAAVRFLSCEPLLGPVDLAEIAAAGGVSRSLFGPLAGYCQRHHPRRDCGCERQQPKIDWVIVGGESGLRARPMHPAWARSLRDQCAAAGVPFFFKHWGEWTPTSSVDIYCHGPERSARQYPHSAGIGWLSDGRICMRDFSVAEHARRVATGAATCSRAVEVDREALAAFHATLDDPAATPVGYQWMYRVGKKLAGRLLDGVQHDGMPEARTRG